MLDSLKRGSPEHEDMVNQLHQMQDNVHYTFFECFLTLAGQESFISQHCMETISLFAIGLVRASSKVLTNVLFYSFYMLDFPLAENLEKLAFELSRMPLPDGSAETDFDQEQSGPDRFMGLIAGNEVTSQHQRFLMVLSNAGFCNSHLLPELSRKYQHVWSYAG